MIIHYIHFGLLDPDELTQKYKSLIKGEKVENIEEKSYTYDEILDLRFKLVLNTDYYIKSDNIWRDMSEDEEFMKKLLNEAEDIKVVRNYQNERRKCWNCNDNRRSTDINLH